jgi:predicted acylesterase/phospholipase RssA
MDEPDIPPPPQPPPDTLVFSGGGPDGFAFIGCLRHLEANAMMSRVRTIVGCSAGSIIALFVALGMTSIEIETWATRGVEDRSLCDVDIEGILSLVERLGIDDGEHVMASVRSVVAERLCKIAPRLCATSKGAAAGDPTFLELAKATGRDLVVCVSNLEMGDRELLSVDTAPDVSVSLAVRMSISVPMLFTPVRAKLRADGPTCTYVDGGLFDFCPVAHIVSSKSATATVAFRVSLGESTVPSGNEQNHGDAPLTMSAYCALIARAILMRSSHTSHPDAAATCTNRYADVDTYACAYADTGGNRTLKHSTNPTLARVRTVDIPSLMLQPPDVSGVANAVSFDVASMSLEVNAEGIERYVRHGMACASRALASGSS